MRVDNNGDRNIVAGRDVNIEVKVFLRCECPVKEKLRHIGWGLALLSLFITIVWVAATEGEISPSL